MIKIYHNPRCRKSREGLALIINSGNEFKIIEYLKETPSKDELKNIIDLLEINPLELVRKNEKVWKDNYKGKDLSDEAIIKAMVEHPKLIERPIVINGLKAVIGRPPESINTII